MITLITGGQRSGKSAFAERLAKESSASPVYLATSRVLDDEMSRRVEAHRRRRGPEWTSIEEPLAVGSVTLREGATVLLDCLTMLAANWLFECGNDAGRALAGLSRELEALFARNAHFIVVTNEIGLGGISADPLQRRFTDLQGSLNSLVASMAREVYIVVSGIPVKIKQP
ncbi:MAG: bifunctional adenosylcobinamide kinase/adenosylcobinamide-phosphate guanylyltransferase [Pseudoflavonifractor sp.]|nr:bifunctional adenosylcobinamide kinase/adenosylcobinamide-phosphate guanylyltransferase [Alloprevotella sp.]MCM1117438.1 bifunctional adenosylcobinamide kinase/adenosylcobinamide-phosphate guanylyltransferase [Pseudoflavonifractor sp.]